MNGKVSHLKTERNEKRSREKPTKVQTSSCTTNESLGCDIQQDDYSLQPCVVYSKVAKRVELKCSHHKKKKLCLCAGMGVH